MTLIIKKINWRRLKILFFSLKRYQFITIMSKKKQYYYCIDILINKKNHADHDLINETAWLDHVT
jgi:hypothetical protein